MSSWRIACFALALSWLAPIMGHTADDTVRAERVHDLMSEELEPAAEIIWDSAGWIITEDGEEELWPTTDDGWANVAEGAARIAEISGRLAASDYAGGRADWVEISEGLTAAAERARRAAEAHDKQELFDAGGHLYRVCVACHERYMIDDERQ
jgi:hypothetical protein